MTLNGKKVLVTGADGFIGSHLVEALVQEGAEVRAFVLYNSFNSWGWLDTVPKSTLEKIEIIAGDVRDIDFVMSAVTGCEVVFHLAALISIPFSYESPRSYVDTNIIGTLNILTASRFHKVSRVIVTSTSEVYGTAQYVPIDEAHPHQGQSPYSASKIGADRVSESFFRAFGLPVVIVRPFNTYGPRQSARAVIPTVITQILSGSKEIKLGRTDPVRDFVYVKDTVSAFIAISVAENVIGEEINISTGTGISIGEVVEKIVKIIGSSVNVVTEDRRVRPDASEVERLIGSNEKIKKLTSWAPRFDLESGLRETTQWFGLGDNLVRYKSDRYNF